MAEQNEENLEMSLFDSNSNLELNFSPEGDYEDEDIDLKESLEDETTSDVPSDETTEDNINLDEDQDDSEEVVEEEDQNTEGDNDNSETETDDSDSSKLYSSFASTLSEQGLLPSFDLEKLEDIKSVDDLSNIFKTEIDSQVKNYIVSKLGDDGYEALEKGVSLSDYQTHQNTINTLDGITEDTLKSDPELTKQILYQDYINQGLSKERAQRLVIKSAELGEESLFEDGKESLTSMRDFEKTRLESLKAKNEEDRQKQQAYQEKIDNDLKNSIYNSKEYIPGIKVNKTIQDKVYDNITKIVSKNPDTGVMENKLMKQRRENPIEFDTKLYYLHEITNGFSDFSKLMSKVESKSTSQLEKELRRTSFQSTGKPSFIDDKESYNNSIGSELIL